jgi:2'-5' RNA ligase
VIRRQLSLFVAEPAASRLEALRAVLDPVQQSLIPVHATLAREDELAFVFEEDLQARLHALREPGLRLRFGAAEAFFEHGILLPCIQGAERFDALRARLLSGLDKPLAPHITLAHPRNPRAPGNCLAAVLEALPAPLDLAFDSLNLVEQHDGGPWRVLLRVLLASPERPISSC